jgi:saccharopine dehydrogenase (NAD+, L-lysine-forming)
MLPLESSEDYAGQLQPTLAELSEDSSGVWSRARATFQTHLAAL